MLADLTNEEIQAVLMFDAIKFRDLWEAGAAMLTDDEDAEGYKEQMFDHAARVLALWSVVKINRRLGWFRRMTTKRFVSQVESALVQCGALVDVMRKSRRILLDCTDDEAEVFRLKRLGRGIIRLSPALDPREVGRIDEYLALARGT